jgi:RHS repeat-associated protein
VETEFLVDKNRDYAQVLEESVNDALTASYVYGLDLISQERGNVDSFYLVDGLGSTRGLANASGVVTDTYAYDAFGNSIASAGNVENDYLFAGEQFDGDLDQYYLRDRYYNPSAGRFTRVDSYEGRRRDPMSRHDYLYAHANPVNFIDPSGLSTTMMELNSVMDTIGALAAIAWVSWSVPKLVFTTKEALDDLLDLYVPYFASRNKGKKGKSGKGNEENSEDQENQENQENQEEQTSQNNQENQGQNKSDPTPRERKTPTSGSGKEKSTDVPSWLKQSGERPFKGESGKEFADRVMNDRFGKGNYDKGPRSDYNKIKKYGDRGFQ